jgi:hypothetical protein
MTAQLTWHGDDDVVGFIAVAGEHFYLIHRQPEAGRERFGDGFMVRHGTLADDAAARKANLSFFRALG